MLIALVAVAALATPFASAQVAGDGSEISIAVVSVGLKNKARAGEWTGVMVQITDRSSVPREVMVRWEIPDADGDTAYMQRDVTTNPGTKQNVWLYGRLPYPTGGGSPTELKFSVHKIENGVVTGEVGRLTHIVRAWGGTGTSPIVPARKGIMAVVGEAPRGLELLNLQGTFGDEMALAAGHEMTELTDPLRVVDLPDRWMGYAGVSVLIWTAGPNEADPAAISQVQADALREWLYRGGHMIVVLPSIGQTWSSGNNRLLDVMPRVRIERTEDVNLVRYEPFLRGYVDRSTSSKAVLAPAMPTKQIVHTFTPLSDAKPGEAMAIFNGPEQETVIVRRLVGAGAVTLIGIDIASQAVRQSSAIEPTVFWNRILGRRGELINKNEVEKRSRAGRGGGMRSPVQIDPGIGKSITKTGQAAQGLLMAMVVFVAYWLVAGPVAFKVLKMRGQVRHAWVAFVLAATVFAGISWGGASVLKPTKIDATHFTIVDDVFGQSVQRARAWVTFFLPRFGEMRVGVDNGEDKGMTNTVSSWEQYSMMDAGVQKYPDARAYEVTCRDPHELAVPTRSTVKSVMIDWAGGSRWKMPMPMPESPVRIRYNESGATLEGRLVHELPGTLRNVTAVIVREQNDPASPGMGMRTLVPARASAYSLAAWAPGTPLDLATLGTANRSGFDEYLNRLALGGYEPRGRANWGGGRRNDDTDSETATTDDQMMAMTFFPLLEPPAFEPNNYNAGVTYYRTQTHGLDIARWVTQPCIIIIGVLRDEGESPSPCPIPLTVDGEKVPSGGRTLVRWVYPLPPRPPEVRMPSGLMLPAGPVAPDKPATSPAP